MLLFATFIREKCLNLSLGHLVTRKRIKKHSWRTCRNKRRCYSSSQKSSRRYERGTLTVSVAHSLDRGKSRNEKASKFWNHFSLLSDKTVGSHRTSSWSRVATKPASRHVLTTWSVDKVSCVCMKGWRGLISGILFTCSLLHTEYR